MQKPINDFPIKNIKHIHFLGISGISMKGLSIYTLETFPHIKITGHTDIEDFFIKNIEINKPIENFIKNINICVYTSSIMDHNEELQKIKKFNELNNNQIILLKRSEYLHLITSNKERICILGAHGKTSITTYSHQLLSSLNPLTFVGAHIEGYDHTFLVNTYKDPEIHIVENDESENGFLNLISEYTIIPNISNDHLDNYNNSFEEYLNTFKKYFQLVKEKNKYIIYNKNNEYANNTSRNFHEILHKLVIDSNLKNISYGYKNSDVNIKILSYMDGVFQWQLNTNLEELKNINNKIYRVKIIGIWNIYNITSSIILGALKNIPIGENLNLIKPSRRLEVIYNKNNKIILDDYGVHPFEIENVIKACESIYKNITYIWEPHRISRVNFFKEDFKKLFNNRNLFYTDIYEVNTKKEGEFIKINDFIDYGIYIHKDDLINLIKNNSVIVIFSAGNLSKKVKLIIKNYL
jgi:UDP-N-acetylmuramate--alanine ligase